MSDPFTQIGGRDAVVQLAERFYDIMDQREPRLAALHRLDAHGKVSRESRDRFAMFLVGWLGGPQDYVAAHGHPRLRMRHGMVRVDVEMRDAWLRCMDAALTDCAVPEGVAGFLRQRFADVADFLRNVEEGVQVPAAEQPPS
jgi:hemoglobin